MSTSAFNFESGIHFASSSSPFTTFCLTLQGTLRLHKLDSSWRKLE